jgi:hypothetical protein
LFFVLPAHLGRLQRLAVEFQAVVEQGDRVLAHRAIGQRLHTDQVFLFHPRVLADQVARDAAILREHQQAGGIDVQPPGRCQAAQVAGVEAKA